MGSYFQTITESNKLNLNKPVGTDMVYYSELNEWFTVNAFRSFSLKYVIDRCIHYKVGSMEYNVPAQHFLLATKQPDVKAYFESSKPVKSICIDIRPETIEEAFTVLCAKDDNNLDNYLSGYFQHPNFFESVCPVSNGGPVRSRLNSLVNSIYEETTETRITREWFLDLAEKIIYHEYGNHLALNGIQSVKISTRKEILQRLKAARDYMDNCYADIEDIGEVARKSNLSEFHFFRSFKQAFGITPYQYILQKRLEKARYLLLNEKMEISKIAMQCGFTDLPSFSKSFKKRFGSAPSIYINAAS